MCCIVVAQGIRVNKSFNLLLGNKTKSMLGDEFTKECRSLEKYIQLLLVHSVFCADENLKKFLIEEEVLSDIFNDSFFYRKSTVLLMSCNLL
jgi:hypothetical protein